LIFGSIIGGAFIYFAGGVEVAQGSLYIPYLVVAIVALLMSVAF